MKNSTQDIVVAQDQILDANVDSHRLPYYDEIYGDDSRLPDFEFDSWASAKQSDYFTKAVLKYDHSRVIIPGEKSQAVVVQSERMTRQEWQERRRQHEERCDEHPVRAERFEREWDRLKVQSLPGGKVEVIRRTIPVYHWSQTEPGNFRERTKAIIEFAKVFWRSSNSGSYIQKNLHPDQYDAKWWTKDFDQDFVSNPFEFFNDQKFRDHIRQREIFGVKPDSVKPQWWCAADIDLHVEQGGNPTIFLKQVEAVLSFLQGKGWIVCLGIDNVDGIHVLKFFDNPLPLDDARAVVQNMLDEVCRLHPQLEEESMAAGMSLARAEVFPDKQKGFRLPLGIGYTSLTSKPLTLVKYHTYKGVPLYGADVVGLMNWDGKEMPLEAKIDYIRKRIPKSVADQNVKLNKTAKRIRRQQVKAENAAAADLTNTKLLGKMKGRYRQVLVEFYSGRTQVPKSLQTGILLGVTALWAIDFPLEDRADYLLGLLKNIEVTNPNFSSRLNNEAWEEILDDIEHVIDTNEKLRTEPVREPRIKTSIRILTGWAEAMRQIGFDFGDPSTWEQSFSPSGKTPFPQFTLTEEEVELVTQYMAPVFCCDPTTACEAVCPSGKRAKSFLRGVGAGRTEVAGWSGGGGEGGERLAVAPGQETLRACGDCGPVAQ